MNKVNKITKKKIGFTLKPSVKRKEIEEQKPKKDLVDIHFDIAKKMDALIKEDEKESMIEDETGELISEQQTENLSEMIRIESREPIAKKVEVSTFDKNIQQKNTFNENIENLLRIDLPVAETPDFKFVTALEPPKTTLKTEDSVIMPASNIDLLNRLIGTADVAVQKKSEGFINVKLRKREDVKKIKEQNVQTKKTTFKTQHKNIEAVTADETEEKNENGLEKTRKDVEKAKKEAEKRKKELEALEEELERQKIERQRKAKEVEELKKLELKKIEELAKEKEKELKEKVKKREKELKRQVKLEAKKKRIEAKNALKEEKKKQQESERQKKLKTKQAEKKTEQAKKPLFSKLKDKTKSDKQPLKPEKKKINIFAKKEKVLPLKTEHLHLEQLSPTQEHVPLSTAAEHPLHEKKNMVQIEFDEDVKKVLLMTDDLLGKLPEDVIGDFANSKDFQLYEKVLSKYKHK